MHRLYKSHGKHCALRSFPTKCPKCREDVFYWECTHGCKIFFTYPVYGKLIRHICKNESLSRKNKFPVIVKTPVKLFKEENSTCSVCGKNFKSLNDLNSHLKEIKKLDPLHTKFYKNKLKFEEDSSEKSLEEKKRIKMRSQPKFGEINIKKRNL